MSGSLPYASLEDVQAWACAKMQGAPDFVIGDAANPYLRRWWIVPRNRQCNVYLHEILRSDDDRALHDHPWDNTSFLIEGEYTEIAPVFPGTYSGPGRAGDQLRETVRRAGDVVSRSATDSHRLIVPGGGRAVSLFMTGPNLREWGFWCAKGWVHWKDFTGGANGELVGRGCE